MSSQAPSSVTDLYPYDAPSWAKQLKGIPSHKLKLGHLDTPINRWQIPGTPKEFEVYIKRDDMTGSVLSGNKLDFLLADALQKGCKHVISCGAITSNHARATAVAATQCGLKPHLLLRTDIQSASEAPCDGNMFLNRLAGADVYIAPRKSPYATELKPRMEQLAEKIKSETSELSYHIPVGGSNPVGMWGYINAFQELLQQGLTSHFSDIVFACGSAGTAEGLAIANYLSKAGLRVHGIAVSDDRHYFHNHVNETLKSIGIEDVKSQDILHIVEGYKGRGYGLNTQEELDYAVEVSTSTGIMLDPCYSLKGAIGMVSELQKNPTSFQGNKILFIHTGGIFGMYDGKLNETLLKPGSSSNNVKLWTDKDKPPF